MVSKSLSLYNPVEQSCCCLTRVCWRVATIVTITHTHVRIGFLMLSFDRESLNSTVYYFTAMRLDARHLNESEAAADLVLKQTCYSNDTVMILIGIYTRKVVRFLQKDKLNTILTFIKRPGN